MKNPTTSERTSDRELVVTRTFNAPARIVFEAWTRPELFTRWWVPKSTGMSLLSCEMDVRVGVHTGWWLGRRPDHRPMPTLLQWELSDKGGLMLSSSPEIAARGAIFLYVEDLAAERRRLDGLGIALGENNDGDYSTLAQVRDPDGNLITFASPPRRPFPPA